MTIGVQATHLTLNDELAERTRYRPRSVSERAIRETLLLVIHRSTLGKQGMVCRFPRRQIVEPYGWLQRGLGTPCAMRALSIACRACSRSVRRSQ
jgi:hypothetical protein